MWAMDKSRESQYLIFLFAFEMYSNAIERMIADIKEEQRC
jgi:hypothetical protein